MRFLFHCSVGFILLSTAVAFAAQARESAPPKKAFRMVQDIPYYDGDRPRRGDSAYIDERCRLDIHAPEGGENLPVVLYFHGGGLVGGQKYIPEPLKRPDLIVVAPNYRLSSERARCPDYLDDAAAAAAWVFRHIAEYGGDPEFVFVSGGSGGGYLAAMIGMDPTHLARFGESHLRFAGIFPVSGQMTVHMQILNERRGTSGLTQPIRPVVDEFAPIFHAAPDLPPIALFVGDEKLDWPARAEENALLAAQLVRVAGHRDTHLHILSGFNHGNVYDAAFMLFPQYISRYAGMSLGKRLRPLTMPAAAIVGRQAEWRPFQARRGGDEPMGTRFAMSRDDADLIVEFDCPEPAMDALVQGEKGWDGDCVELYIQTEPDKTGQWVVTPFGRCDYYAYRGLADPAAQAAAEKGDAGWRATLRIPLANLPATFRVNALRRRQAGGGVVFTGWSPLFGAANFEADAMVPTTLAP